MAQFHPPQTIDQRLIPLEKGCRISTIQKSFSNLFVLHTTGSEGWTGSVAPGVSVTFPITTPKMKTLQSKRSERRLYRDERDAQLQYVPEATFSLQYMAEFQSSSPVHVKRATDTPETAKADVCTSKNVIFQHSCPSRDRGFLVTDA